VSFALIVVDMQEYFCSLDSPLGRLITVAAPEEARWYSERSDLPVWARRHNETAVALVGEHCYPPLTDPSARVIGALAPRAGEAVVTKTTSGPLAGTDIAAQLRAAGVDRVVVTGVATNVCVTGMARELADADFDAYVVADACSTPSRTAHAAALDNLGGTFATLIETEGVLGDLRHISAI
jgi:nicotinamidase-related amidase